MLRVEFHCHTISSKDCLLRPSDLVRACARKGIDRVVVTDHNAIDGALASQALDPVRVIVGEEIMTSRGEILAAFVKEFVPPGLTPLDTIQRLRSQDAFISVSHPFDSWRPGAWKEQDLLDIIGRVDAIEVFNSRCTSAVDNRRAADFARGHSVAGTVGSDAHTAWELGRSTLLLPQFDTAAGLRLVLPQARPEMRLSPPWIHLSSRYARFRKLLQRDLDAPHSA
jgi:predicted metal-dependent phosphoesterase TrpH